MRNVEMSDFELAKWLRSKGAIDNYKPIKNGNNVCRTEYFDTKGNMVALIIFDNVASRHWVYLAD